MTAWDSRSGPRSNTSPAAGASRVGEDVSTVIRCADEHRTPGRRVSARSAGKFPRRSQVGLHLRTESLLDPSREPLDNYSKKTPRRSWRSRQTVPPHGPPAEIGPHKPHQKPTNNPPPTHRNRPRPATPPPGVARNKVARAEAEGHPQSPACYASKALLVETRTSLALRTARGKSPCLPVALPDRAGGPDAEGLIAKKLVPGFRSAAPRTSKSRKAGDFDESNKILTMQPSCKLQLPKKEERDAKRRYASDERNPAPGTLSGATT